MILVTGAAGKTGRAVVSALAARGEPVRALVRSSAHVEPLQACGAREIAVGSFADAASLQRAATGVVAIHHICPNVSPHELEYGTAVIAAANDAGVRRFVYHSVLHPQVEVMPHHWAKLRVEERLLASGLDVTILQPTAYMQNILAGWGGIVGTGVYRVPYPVETRISLVDLHDVAQAAAVVLTQPGHEGATYELVGTTPLSQSEVAAVLGEALGRPVRAAAEPVADWEARARAGGLGDYQRDTLVAMFRSYAQHGLVGNPNVLRWLIGRAPTTLAEFARDTMAGE